MATGTNLSVREVRTPRGSTEARFEARICGKLGVYSHHTADKWLTGIADRYVAGGNWIEFKVMTLSGKRPASPLRLFTHEQKMFLDRMDKNGDRSWACVQFRFPSATFTVLVPWRVMREHGTWTADDCWRHGTDAGDEVAYLAHRFGKEYDRFSNGDYYGR